jgi:hypothetical protein
VAAYLTKKVLFLRLALPALAAGSVFFLTTRFSSRFTPGEAFDALISLRGGPSAAREIQVIETGGRLLSPAELTSALLTLTEMSAKSLILLAPLLPGAGDGERGGGELLYRFDEEFKTINGNIKNLFDGIRLGSIEPEDASRFVGETVRLAEESKERLLQAAARNEEGYAERFEKAAAVFGGVYIPADAQIVLGRPAAGELSRRGVYTEGYSRGGFGGGRLRRIEPYRTAEDGETREHVVWTALSKSGAVPEESARFLDGEGAFIVPALKEGEDFNTTALSRFLEYEELEKTLFTLLAEEPRLARYGGVALEKYPAFLYEKARNERERMLDEGGEEARRAWRDAKTAFYESLAAFFGAGVRENITHSFEKLIAEEKLDEAGSEKLRALSGEELRKYDIAREVYAGLRAIREPLAASLAGTFCIMGAREGAEEEAAGGTDNPVESSALLANAILKGAMIETIDARDTLLRSLLPSFLLILIMLKMRLAASFACGVILSGAVFAGFCYSFALTGLWLDPRLPAFCAAAAGAASFCAAFAARQRMAGRLRRLFACRLSPAACRRLIGAKKPLPENKRSAETAVVAIRHPLLYLIENKENPLSAAEKIETFYAEAREALVKAGALIISCGGDTISGAFGSPLDALSGGGKRRALEEGGGGKAAEKAARFIASCAAGRGKNAPWCFGLDYGLCAFGSSPLSGYTARGRAAVRARLLARLCVRYKALSLISGAAKEKIDASLSRPLWRGKKRKGAQEYYELIIKS